MYVKSAYNREYPSVYRGIVEDNNDPKRLGRCKIRIPAVYGELTYPVSMLPWARPIALSPIGKTRGSANIPDVGDIVWVMFGGASRDYPIYMGGTYALGDLPIDPNRVDFYVDGSNHVSYDRTNKSYTISTPNSTIVVSPAGISMIGDTTINGDLQVRGNLSVSGTTTVSNLVITGYCNKECNCP